MPEENEVDMESTYVDDPESSIDVPLEPGETYTIKVDGVEEQVSLEELQNGYQRHSDYTRKTQEVAAERDRLHQAEQIVSALENNPEETLRTLAQSFDLDFGGQPDSSSQDYNWEEEEDPTAKKIAALEKRVEQSESVRRQEAVERQVSNLQETYGDFDSRELLNHALRHKIPNLEAAYTHWRFDEVKSTADKLTKEQEIVSKKREAAVVEPGGSTQMGTDSKPTSIPKSIREAFAQAKEQLST
mgnify:CR=1 FL=1